MAREWIKWVKGLPGRGEIRIIARELGISRYAAAGHFMAMMEWADDETTDGFLRGMTLKDLDDAAGLRGFAAALLHADVNWAKQDARGVTLANFTRHNGDTAKRRLVESEKKRQQRDECPGSEGTNVPSAKGQLRDQRREEKRRNIIVNCGSETRADPAAPGDDDDGSRRGGGESGLAVEQEARAVALNARLRKLGIDKAREVVRDHSEAEIAVAIELSSGDRVKNRTGMVLSKLRSGAARDELAERERQQAERSGREAKQRDDRAAEKAAQDRQEAEREQRRAEARRLLAESEGVRTRLVAEYRATKEGAFMGRRLADEALIERACFLDWVGEAIARGVAAAEVTA